MNDVFWCEVGFAMGCYQIIAAVRRVGYCLVRWSGSMDVMLDACYNGHLLHSKVVKSTPFIERRRSTLFIYSLIVRSIVLGL